MGRKEWHGRNGEQMLHPQGPEMGLGGIRRQGGVLKEIGPG